MFNDHSLCDSSWCHRKCNEKGSGDKTGPSERAMYNKIKEKYSRYISIEFLKQCRHLYDPQLNEGLNQCVTKCVPKRTNFFATTSPQIGSF